MHLISHSLLTFLLRRSTLCNISPYMIYLCNTRNDISMNATHLLHLHVRLDIYRGNAR